MPLPKEPSAVRVLVVCSTVISSVRATVSLRPETTISRGAPVPASVSSMDTSVA
jgi:hypothetical protein